MATDEAAKNAVEHPVKPPEYVPEQYGGTYRYGQCTNSWSTRSCRRPPRTGARTLTFASGATLEVELNQDHEARTVSGPGVFKVVCMPGGDVAARRATSNGAGADEC